jgi:hypothetical protein
MNGLWCGLQKQGGLFVRRRPASFTIDALPVQIELDIDQNDSFGTPASGAGDVVFVEDLEGRPSSSPHT